MFGKKVMDCRAARGLMERYADGRLPDKTAVAFENHLANCAACRQLAQEEPQWLNGLRHAPRWQRLSAAETAVIRQKLYRSMNRRMIMRNTATLIQSAATLFLLALVVGLFVWWQRQEIEPLATTPPATPAAVEADQVAIALAVDSASLNRYRPLIELFEAEHPHIRVRLAEVTAVANPDESIRALASSFDVFAYSPNRQGETQYLLDLRPFLDLDPQFDPGDFLPGLLPESSEPLWAIPTGAAYYLTFYDKSAFAAAGLDAPELNWTVDDFLTAAQALIVHENGEVTRWGYVPAQLRYSPLLAAQLTAPLQTADGLRLTDPDIVAAVQQKDRLTRIDLAGETTALELGELATLTIILEERENVLWLPPAPLRTFQGRNFVVVQDGDVQRRVDVRLGIQSDERVEILEGVSEGQIVVGP